MSDLEVHLVDQIDLWQRKSVRALEEKRYVDHMMCDVRRNTYSDVYLQFVKYKNGGNHG